MRIMRSIRKKERCADAVAAPTQAEPGTTPLILLVPDAQGIATYKLRRFPTARAAEVFIDLTHRGRPSKGAVCFWALTRRPDDCLAEPLVLVRDNERPIVYLFSFANLDACHDFIRHEMTRGLELYQVMVYWAVPACLEADSWGRAAITPSAAPRPASSSVSNEDAQSATPERGTEIVSSARIVPFLAKETPAIGERRRYLKESDIAETVREMEEFAATFEAECAPVIDFPSASKQIRRAQTAARARNAWANFSLAVDEALDAYVAQQVRARLALNRVMRALAEAAIAASIDSADVNGQAARPDRIWVNASTALADAATVAIRRGLMQRVWMNTAWTLEEAVYAQRLETNARVMRGWRFASMACAEAAAASIVRDAAQATNANQHERKNEAASSPPTNGARTAAAASHSTTLPDDDAIAAWLEKQGVFRPDRDGRAGTSKRISRWEPREEPFEGFRSPPGRF